MQLPPFTDFASLVVATLTLALPIAAALLTVFHHRRIARGRSWVIRPLAGIGGLQERLGSLSEAGRPVHIATGSGQAGAIGPSAATLAGVSIAQRIADLATSQGGQVDVTDGDIAAHLATRGTVRQAYRQSSLALDYRVHAPHLVAHQTPAAYAAGVTHRLALQEIDSNVIAGELGSESLLIAEEGARYGPQLSGTTTLAALPGLMLSTDATLIGEELFAADAYLATTPTAKARLLTQDTLRTIVVLLLIAGVVYQVVNLMFRLGLPSL
jgi:hypothetical protein